MRRLSFARSTGQPQPMQIPRVHKAPAGFAYAPMPEQLKGEVDKVHPGGLPPVPYRARNDWGSGYKRNWRDGSSPECNAECFHSVAELGEDGKWKKST